MKRTLSVLLSFIFICSLFTGIDIQSVGAITKSEFDNKISALRSEFPNYSEWHSSFSGAIECCGFAYLLGYRVYGTVPNTWTKVYNMNNVKPGDVIQYGNANTSGHTIFVTGVSGDTITFVDCNANGNYSGANKVRTCGIKWDNTVVKNRALFGYSFSYVLSSPNIDTDEQYADLGTDFYAYITNTAYWLYLSNDYSNVSAKSATYLTEQIWRFERQYDKSYVIKSASDDKCLDVDQANASNGTNVKVCEYNGSDAQKWFFICKGENKYVIKSKLGNCVLDLADGLNVSGNNIQIYEPNGTDSQYFSVHKYETPSVVNINVEVEGTSVRVNWENVYGASRYDVYLIQAPCNWEDVKYHKKVDFNINYCEFKDVALGNYYAFVVTQPNDKYTQSNWVNFNVNNEDLLITGDANDDGDVNIQDATMVQMVVAKFPVENFNEKLADYDQNGEINIRDATAIQMIVAKLV